MAIDSVQIALNDAMAEALAKWWHETYEELAPEYGYETRKETAVAWDDIPDTSANKRLMIAVAKKFLSSNFISYNSDVETSTGGTGEAT